MLGQNRRQRWLRIHFSRRATRRWPVAAWQIVLDVAAVNVRIYFRQATGDDIALKHFLVQLIQQLNREFRPEKYTNSK